MLRVQILTGGRVRSLVIPAVHVQHLIDGSQEYLDARGRWICRIPAACLPCDATQPPIPSPAP
jgi:hypothetical protein